LFTVIVPIFDERATLEICLQRTVAASRGNQVILVDDASRDGAAEIAERFAATGRVKLLRHDSNRGKGAAIRTALQEAVGQFTIIQDADLEYDPQDYPELLEPLLTGDADVVYGSRYLGGDTVFTGRWRFDWGVKLLNLAVWLIYGVKLTDEATCYKVLPTSLLRAMDLQCERFDFCPEVTAKACRLGLRMREVPIRYSPRSLEDGKKIRLTDGIEALRVLWRHRKWRGSWRHDFALRGGTDKAHAAMWRERARAERAERAVSKET